jgi:hypothetical protein
MHFTSALNLPKESTQPISRKDKCSTWTQKIFSQLIVSQDHKHQDQEAHQEQEVVEEDQQVVVEVLQAVPVISEEEEEDLQVVAVEVEEEVVSEDVDR